MLGVKSSDSRPYPLQLGVATGPERFIAPLAEREAAALERIYRLDGSDSRGPRGAMDRRRTNGGCRRGF
jgi:hypothetical protein